MVEITASLLTSSIASLESLLREPEPTKPQQKFLRFRLGKDHPALVAVEDVLAVLTIAIVDVLPVPQMSAYVLGICNWRNEAVWLVDASNQMGFEPLSVHKGSKHLTVIVAQSRGKSLGLVVPELQDIESHDPEELVPASPELFSAQLLPFVKGYLSGDRSIVLNVTAILQDRNLQLHKLSKL